MINLDFSTAIAGYAMVFLGAIFILWLSGNKLKDKKLLLDEKLLWFCSVCTYTYIITKEEEFSTCPRCGSYNKKTLT
jgi:hypothetical protein